MNKINYQKLLDEVIASVVKNDVKPRLLLHACCAPCSSYVLEYLSEFFEITLYFYNPNIFPSEEYAFRAEELKRLACEMTLPESVKVEVEDYNSDEFYNKIAGRERDPEGGARCKICYELRLRRAAEYAAEHRFDYFTTTLSISPYKNSVWINEIGESMAKEYGVKHLPSDFKKNNGYKRSIELSKEYELYRQDYCGCEYSKK
ncbi:MAG: epoxyqueuosine reductase QueH [Ruminococcaceae bacterium]|nr:epoxyqueuosine reductase QueH [Oscillospiraceae bacterium]